MTGSWHAADFGQKNSEHFLLGSFLAERHLAPLGGSLPQCGRTKTAVSQSDQVEETLSVHKTFSDLETFNFSITQ